VLGESHRSVIKLPVALRTLKACNNIDIKYEISRGSLDTQSNINLEFRELVSDAIRALHGEMNTTGKPWIVDNRGWRKNAVQYSALPRLALRGACFARIKSISLHTIR
jgi:hypothetical protein